MPDRRPGRVAAVGLLAAIATLTILSGPARADVVLLGTSSGPPSAQDANLYDWQGEWTSALDRAAPAPGQRPAWQVNVGLYGDTYMPSPLSNIIEQLPTCTLTIQIAGSPPVTRYLYPCVEGPARGGVPVPETLTPDIADAGNGPHTVTVTSYDRAGAAISSATFTASVDNTLPSPNDMSGPFGWQRGDAVVSSTAATSGPSGIGGQTCQTGSAAASWYPGPTARLAVTGDGAIPVRCTAQNNAGVPGPVTEFDALLDNSPPTGAFEPADPANPTRVAVAVADPESGVASGEVEISDAGQWRVLPTRYDAASGELVARIPDDASLSDGVHSLATVVSDAVGNEATVTSNVNGAAESVLLPLRILTRIRVGGARVLVKRCRVGVVSVRSRRRIAGQRPARRLVRRCPLVALPGSRGALKLRYGQAARVRGIVLSADGEPIENARVEVSQQAPGWTAVGAGQVMSDAHGRFTYRILPGPSRTVTFSFPGSDVLRAASASASVQAYTRGTIRASRVVRAGVPMRLSGRLLGGFIPPGGVLIQLHYQVRGYPEGWAPFNDPVHTDRRGFWHTSLTLSSAAAGFTYQLKGVVSSQNGWPYAGAVTNVIARHVLR